MCRAIRARNHPRTLLTRHRSRTRSRPNTTRSKRATWPRLIPLSQVTATMAQADVLEASEAGRTFLVARLAAIPIWRPIGALLTHRGPKGGIEYPGTAG